MLPHSHANELGQSHRCCERPVARCEKSFEHVCLGSIHVVHSQTLPPHLMSSSCFCRYPARQSPQCHEVLGWNTMRIDAQAFYASGAQTEGHGHCMEAIPAHYSESKAAPKLCDILRLHPHPKSHSPSTTFTNLQPQMAQKHSILGKLHAVYPAPRHACGAAVKSAAMGGIASSKLPPVNDKDLRTPGHVCR